MAVLEREYKQPTHNTGQEVISRAHSVLGYSGYDLGGLHPSLVSVLTKLEIVPFTAHSVEAYKRSKESVTLLSGTKTAIWLWALSACLCGVLVWGTRQPKDSVMLITFGVLMAIVIATSFIVACTHFGEGTRTRTKWEYRELRDYKQAVPVHVLNKVLQIKEALPNATFYVYYLVKVEEEVVKPLPDPFLAVCYGGTTAYIEAWDEKSFEQSL